MKNFINLVKRSIILYQLGKIRIEGTFTINDDLSVSVDGDVVMSGKNLSEIPVNFRDVSGDFDCSFNKLKTLKNSPKIVGKNFFCDTNRLITLKGCPEKVGERFVATHNNISSLSDYTTYALGVSNFSQNPISDITTLPYTVTHGGILIEVLQQPKDGSSKSIFISRDELVLRCKKHEIEVLKDTLFVELEVQETPFLNKRIKV